MIIHHEVSLKHDEQRSTVLNGEKSREAPVYVYLAFIITYAKIYTAELHFGGSEASPRSNASDSNVRRCAAQAQSPRPGA